jgi:hypothetical protein
MIVDGVRAVLEIYCAATAPTSSRDEAATIAVNFINISDPAVNQTVRRSRSYGVMA